MPRKRDKEKEKRRREKEREELKKIKESYKRSIAELSSLEVRKVSQPHRKSRGEEKKRTFEEGLAEYAAFVKANGRPPSNGKSAEERRAYNWMYRQLKSVMDGTITPEHYGALLSMKDIFPLQGAKHRKMVEGHALKESDYTLPMEGAKSLTQRNYAAKVHAIREDFPEKGTRLYGWVAEQLADDGRRLSDWQREIWEEEGFEVKDIRSESALKQQRTMRKRIGSTAYFRMWEQKCREYADFINANGRNPSQLSEDKSEAKLYWWMVNQRKQARKGNRSKEQVSVLKKLRIL